METFLAEMCCTNTISVATFDYAIVLRIDSSVIFSATIIKLVVVGGVGGMHSGKGDHLKIVQPSIDILW